MERGRAPDEARQYATVDITAEKTENPVGGSILRPARRRWRLPRTLVWVAVTPFAAWAVARLAGLERGALTTQLMTATPYAAAASLVPVLIAALARNRAATAVALAATTALGFAVVPRALASSDTATGRPLKVLTINLLFGRADTGAVLDLVRRLQPDVLSTQELTPGAVEELEAAGLKELLPYTYLLDEWSAGGSGLYAKYPLTPLRLFRPIGHQMPAARLDLPGGAPVEIADVHPYPPLGSQVHEWAAALDSFPATGPSGPVRILAGDFNASLDHAAMRRVLDRGYDDAADRAGQGLIPTWPANRGRIPPMITIDHVLVDKRVGVKEVSVHTVPGTDHRAVFASLTLPD